VVNVTPPHTLHLDLETTDCERNSARLGQSTVSWISETHQGVVFLWAARTERNTQLLLSVHHESTAALLRRQIGASIMHGDTLWPLTTSRTASTYHQSMHLLLKSIVTLSYVNLILIEMVTQREVDVLSHLRG
jgi:hypothetical protein